MTASPRTARLAAQLAAAGAPIAPAALDALLREIGRAHV